MLFLVQPGPTDVTGRCACPDGSRASMLLPTSASKATARCSFHARALVSNADPRRRCFVIHRRLPLRGLRGDRVQAPGALIGGNPADRAHARLLVIVLDAGQAVRFDVTAAARSTSARSKAPISSPSCARASSDAAWDRRWRAHRAGENAEEARCASTKTTCSTGCRWCARRARSRTTDDPVVAAPLALAHPDAGDADARARPGVTAAAVILLRCGRARRCGPAARSSARQRSQRMVGPDFLLEWPARCR